MHMMMYNKYIWSLDLERVGHNLPYLFKILVRCSYRMLKVKGGECRRWVRLRKLLRLKGTSIWSWKLLEKIHLSLWNVSLEFIKLSECLKHKIKAGCIPQLFQWLLCRRFLLHFQSIARISSISTWGQVVLAASQYKRQILHAERLIYPRVWQSLFNNSEVKIITEREQLSCWNKGFFKFSIRKLLRQKLSVENHKLVRWTEVKRSERTIILRIELLIIGLDWHFLGLKIWWQEISCRNLLIRIWIKFMRKSWKNWWKTLNNLKSKNKVRKIIMLQLQIKSDDYFFLFRKKACFLLSWYFNYLC